MGIMDKMKQAKDMYGSMKKMQQEVAAKKELMQLEFNYDMQLKQLDVDVASGKEKEKEDRKDERTRIQASQQSEMIDQRNNQKPPKNFETTSDNMMGGFGLDM